MDIVQALRVFFVALLFLAPSAIAIPLGGGGVQIVAPPSVTARVIGSEFQSLLLRPLNMGVGASGAVSALINNSPVNFGGIRGIGRSSIVGLATRGAMMVGPGALVFTLVDLFWDDLTKTWQKLQIDNRYIQGKWCINTDKCGGSPESACRTQHPSDANFYQAVKITDNRFSCRWKYIINGNEVSMWEAYLSFACAPGETFTEGVCVKAMRVPASESDVSSQISGKINSDEIALAESVQLAALPQIGIKSLLDAAGPVSSTSGPATLPATSTTTTSTGPGGQTTTTVTSQPNVSYSNNSNVITITITETTTITNPSGQTETTTKTEQSTKPIDPALTNPDATQKPDEDLCAKYPNSAMCQPPQKDFCELHPESSICKPPKDYCEEHPESLACLKLGDPQNVNDNPNEKTITWTKEMADAGQCPADMQLTIFGNNYAVSWWPVCRMATGLRPFIIIAAWLSAGIFLFGVISRSE